MTRPTVAFLQAYIYQYRVPFYEALREELASRGVDLRLIHGDASGEAAHSTDQVRVPWAHHIDNRQVEVLGKELWWQPALPHLRDVDLVVVEQASSRLINLVLLARQEMGGRPKLAFWGHGRDWRPGRFAAVGEGLKRLASRRAHWWFAYNPVVADIVAALPYPRERITDTGNAVDTTSLRAAVDAIDADDLAALRGELGIPADARVLLFCGAMYPDKRLPFIISALHDVRDRLGDVHLVLVGDGRSGDVARRAAAAHDHVHHVGQRFGDDRAPYFALADLLVLPGAVGLAVLDAFAAGLPVASSASGDHGPEVAYLQDDVNAIVVDDDGDPCTYGRAVAELLDDGERLRRLGDGTRAAAAELTIEGMARRFADGILAALADA